MAMTATNRHSNVVPTVVVNNYCNLSSRTASLYFRLFHGLRHHQASCFPSLQELPQPVFASAVKCSEAQDRCEIEREMGKERKNKKVVRRTGGKMEQNLMRVQ